MNKLLNHQEGKPTPHRPMVDASINQKLLSLLSRLLQSDGASLAPTYHLDSPTGYTYADVADLLGTTKGAETPYLEGLADQQYLLREFFDRVLACPACKSCQLNIRETCPACKSADIAPVSLLHHYRCALVAPEEDFLQGLAYTCPKCQKSLNHIGVDYDKPGQRYRCGACKTLSADVITLGQCRSCDKVTRSENFFRHSVFTYRIGPLAKEAVRTGQLNAPSLSSSHERDPQTGLYKTGFFRKRLKEEIERSQLYKRPLALVTINLSEAKIAASQQPNTNALRKVVTLLRQILSPLDVPTYFEHIGFVCLLLESDLAKATNFSSALQRAADTKENGHLKLTIKVSAHLEESATSHDWLELVESLSA